MGIFILLLNVVGRLFLKVQFSLVQSLSCVQFFVTPWTTASQAFLFITNSWSCSDSCPWSNWCHPTISSSVSPFFSRLQSFPASEYFPMSQFFTSGGQSIGVSASTSVLPMNTQEWSLRRQVKWSGIAISCRIIQFVVIHTIKGFSVVSEEVDVFFWNRLAFSMTQWMLAIWFLVPLLFLNPAWTSGSSFWALLC